MTYNIHPIFVHFPIVLLLLYSVVKIFPLSKWLPKVAWRDIERLFLFLGVLGGLVALNTGEIAEHLVRSASNKDLIEMHSTFANISVWIYGILLLGEILVYINTEFGLEIKFPQAYRYLVLVQNFLTQPVFSRVLALVGLVTISVTGLLGGVIVYGISADPFAPIILKLLGLKV